MHEHFRFYFENFISTVPSPSVVNNPSAGNGKNDLQDNRSSDFLVSDHGMDLNVVTSSDH
jgi:hypothetical protein